MKKKSAKRHLFGTTLPIPTTTVKGKPSGDFRMGFGFVDLMRRSVQSELDHLREQCRDVLDGPQGESVSRLIQTAQDYGYLSGVMSDAVKKSSAELEAIRENLAIGRQRGGETMKIMAAPRRAEIRKRFKEIRQAGLAKTAARELIQRELEARRVSISLRTIERHTRGMA
jgi:hypothetical protein